MQTYGRCEAGPGTANTTRAANSMGNSADTTGGSAEPLGPLRRPMGGSADAVGGSADPMGGCQLRWSGAASAAPTVRPWQRLERRPSSGLEGDLRLRWGRGASRAETRGALGRLVCARPLPGGGLSAELFFGGGLAGGTLRRSMWGGSPTLVSSAGSAHGPRSQLRRQTRSQRCGATAPQLAAFL